MTILEIYFLVFLAIQFFHSIEELSNGFHRRFPFGKLSFKSFLLFEILFFGFWAATFLYPTNPFREEMLAIFIVLMFANGIWHIAWWGIEKKYVPGIITAPLFVVAFLVYYFQVLH